MYRRLDHLDERLKAMEGAALRLRLPGERERRRFREEERVASWGRSGAAEPGPDNKPR